MLSGKSTEWFSAQVLAENVQKEPSMTKFTRGVNPGVQSEFCSWSLQFVVMFLSFTDCPMWWKLWCQLYFSQRCQNIVTKGDALTDITCGNVSVESSKTPSRLIFFFSSRLWFSCFYLNPAIISCYFLWQIPQNRNGHCLWSPLWFCVCLPSSSSFSSPFWPRITATKKSKT